MLTTLILCLCSVVADVDGSTEARITDVLEKLQIPMVDASSALADGVTTIKVSEADRHPNAAAHGVIAEEMMKYLESQLELKPN